MTTYDGIEVPCFGTLVEIHAALIKDLNWLGRQVAINGTGYTVMSGGFRSNSHQSDMGSYHTPEEYALVHSGIAYLYNFEEGDCDLPAYYEIMTSGKIPHVSKRCAECGVQLDQEEIKHGVCDACYSAACGH